MAHDNYIGGKSVGETEYNQRLSDGRILSCLAVGSGEGRPVLYCHGFPGSRLEARLAAEAARRLGLRCYALDRPGFGGSTFQAGRTLGAWAADVEEFADQRSLERFAVIGVSGGGPYALACAARLPDRVTSVALAGALGPVAGGSPGTRGMLPLNRLLLGLAGRSRLLTGAVIGAAAWWIVRHMDHWLARMTAGSPSADRQLLADPGYRALVAESTAQALRQGGRGVAQDLILLARAWDFELSQITVPVRVWHGLVDNVVPPATARYLAATLPSSELNLARGEGHLSLIVRQMDAILAALD